MSTQQMIATLEEKKTSLQKLLTHKIKKKSVKYLCVCLFLVATKRQTVFEKMCISEYILYTFF
jgi:hypothetical protein